MSFVAAAQRDQHSVVRPGQRQIQDDEQSDEGGGGQHGAAVDSAQREVQRQRNRHQQEVR
jgi:hypothetical protein